MLLNIPILRNSFLICCYYFFLSHCITQVGLELSLSQIGLKLIIFLDQLPTSWDDTCALLHLVRNPEPIFRDLTKDFMRQLENDLAQYKGRICLRNDA